MSRSDEHAATLAASVAVTSPLAHLLEPRLAAAARWLARSPGEQLQPAARQALVDWLGRRLLACAAPALVEDPRPELAAYPVARRLCAAAEVLWRERCFALVERLAAHVRAPIVALVVHDGFLGGGAPTIVVTVEDGRRVVYRDRDLRAGAWLLRLAELVNETGHEPPLPVRRLSVHPDHAWDVFVDRTPCATRADVRRYYVRIGMWLRMFEATRTTDMHALNLVAAADAPIIVDLDGVLAARGAPMSPATSGLLPTWFHGDPDRPAVNVGGLHRGGTVVLPYRLEVLRGDRFVLELDRQEVVPTLPELDGELVSPSQFVDDILAGYASLDEVWSRLPVAQLVDTARELTAPSFRRGGTEYRQLLQASVAPALLADEARRDAFLARQVAPDELAALRDLRIPELRGPAAVPVLRALTPDERAANEAVVRTSIATLDAPPPSE